MKRAFSDVENAAGELRAVLPAELVSVLDFGSLRLEPGSFVDDELAESHTDLLYSVRLDGRHAFVYLLFEHQSTVEPLMAYRLLRYACRIWDRWLTENPAAKALPAVIPVVLHHGPGRWTAARRLHELVDLPEELLAVAGRYVPELELVLDDLGAMSIEDVERRTMTAYSRLVLWCLRTARYGEASQDAVAVFARVARELGEVQSSQEALLTILRYLAEVMGDERHDFIDAVLAADGGDAIKEANVMINDRFHERGRDEGGRSMLLKLLTLKFGPSTEAERRVAAASAADLERWAERVLTATRIDEVWE